jgi:DHA1 family L-arabinose/isopropyl-beta-D-thiogalactopyranoside export protein-like MFS transporter
MKVRPWLPLMGLVLCVFMFNMSEFMPIGILTNIAGDLQVSESTAGLIISFYAWAVALLSLPMMLIFVKMEYKRLMILMVSLFALFQFVSGIATSYEMLMAARIGVAVAHSVFWAIVTPMAIMSVPKHYYRLAISAVAAGTSMAMILGLPLGRIIGLSLGWRMSFMTIAIIAVVAAIILIVVLPRMDNPGTFTLKRLPEILKNRVLISIYILVAVFVTGHYTGYSYIEPFLGEISGMSESMITAVLTIIGVAGILAGIVFARYYDRSKTFFMVVSVSGALACLIMFWLLPEYHYILLAVSLFWGLCVTLFTTAFQNETIKAASADGVTVATALMSGIFNLGIAMGSITGGFVMDNMGTSEIPLVGAVITVGALLVLLLLVMPAIRAFKKAS